jgi:hypothetical protein
MSENSKDILKFFGALARGRSGTKRFFIRDGKTVEMSY